MAKAMLGRWVQERQPSCTWRESSAQASPSVCSRAYWSIPYDGKHLRLSVKAVGDVSRAVPSVPPGTRLILEGPHGIFTSARTIAHKVLCVAFGIGITPIRAIAEDLIQQGRDVVLIYGGLKSDEIALREEVEHLSTRYGMPVHHVLSEECRPPLPQSGLLPRMTVSSGIRDPGLSPACGAGCRRAGCVSAWTTDCHAHGPERSHGPWGATCPRLLGAVLATVASLGLPECRSLKCPCCPSQAVPGQSMEVTKPPGSRRRKDGCTEAEVQLSFRGVLP